VSSCSVTLRSSPGPYSEGTGYLAGTVCCGAVAGGYSLTLWGAGSPYCTLRLAPASLGPASCSGTLNPSPGPGLFGAGCLATARGCRQQQGETLPLALTLDSEAPADSDPRGEPPHGLGVAGRRLPWHVLCRPWPPRRAPISTAATAAAAARTDAALRVFACPAPRCAFSPCTGLCGRRHGRAACIACPSSEDAGYLAMRVLRGYLARAFLRVTFPFRLPRSVGNATCPYL